jgi:hypothetical protein
MSDPYRRYAVVRWWKLHVDTGKPLDLPPKDEETYYFKVEGKKRPFVVWTSNSTHSKVVMLTTQPSENVIKLGDVCGRGEVSYFDPRRIERYGNDLAAGVERDREGNDILLAHDLRDILVKEIQKNRMTVSRS